MPGYRRQRGGAMVTMKPMPRPAAPAKNAGGMLNQISNMIGVAAPIASFMNKWKSAKGWREKLGAIKDGIKDNKLLSRGLNAVGAFTKSDMVNNLARAAEVAGYGKRRPGRPRKVGRPKKTTTTRRKTVRRRRQVGGAMSRSSMGSQRFVLQPVWPSPSTIIA